MYIVSGYGTPKISFVEKTFTGGSKTTKFMSVFSLKSFPLYGNCYYLAVWILNGGTGTIAYLYPFSSIQNCNIIMKSTRLSALRLPGSFKCPLVP